MIRLWVVEAKYSDSGWCACDLGTFNTHFASTDFSDAQRLKKELYQELKNRTDYWTKNKFRIVEYVPERRNNETPKD